MKWVVALLLAAVVVLSGCSSKSQEPYKDSPKYPTHDRTTAKIVEMPDGFSNFAVKCIGGIWFMTAYHGDANRTAMAMAFDPHFPLCTNVPALQH